MKNVDFTLPAFIEKPPYHLQCAVLSFWSAQTPACGIGLPDRLRTLISSSRPVDVRRLTSVGAEALAFAFGVALTPADSEELG
jgi:hypothetical protein